MKFSSPLIVVAAVLQAGHVVHGFVPATPSNAGHVITTMSRTSSSFVPASNGIYRPPSSTTTALNMNLVDRFMRVTKSNINKVLSSLEAPEKIMNQAVEDMQSDLLRIRQNYGEITASYHRLKSRLQTEQSTAEDWYARAQLALKRGDESLAKQALLRRNQYLEAAKGLQAELSVQENAMEKLYDSMKILETKIMEAKQKKEQFIARAKTAQSTQKVNDMLSGLTGKTSMDAFKRMEEKVEALEAAAEASLEVSGLVDVVDLDLEKEFLVLEGSAAVDDELAKMKKTLYLEGSPTATASRSMDAELKAMEKKSVQKVPVQRVNWESRWEN